MLSMAYWKSEVLDTGTAHTLKAEGNGRSLGIPYFRYTCMPLARHWACSELAMLTSSTSQLPKRKSVLLYAIAEHDTKANGLPNRI